MDNEKWTFPTLKEYFDRLFEEREIRNAQRFASQEEAVKKAEASTEKRLESVNEFRNTLRDQQTSFLPRPEYEAAHKDLVNQITVLNSRMDKKEGEKTGNTEVWGWVVGAIGFVTGIIGIVYALLKH